MSDCKQCAALQRQNDFLANDRDGYVQLLTDENNKLRAEVEMLRAALEDVVQEATEHHAENVSRAELGGSDMAQRKAKAIVSRSGVLLYKIRFIARAALEGK